jgi:ankyrin repeat protein
LHGHCIQAHWAAAGGDINICRYLYNELGLGFSGADTQDSEGKTPLDIALLFSHSDVADWITKLKDSAQAAI